MKNTSELWLHFGLPKTGTTHLQYHVFPKLNHMAFLGKFSSREKFSPLYHKINNILEDTPRRWALEGREIRRLALKHHSSQPCLWSREGLAEQFLPTLNLWGNVKFDNDFFLGDHLAEMKQHIPMRVGVVLTIRRQDQWLASQYANEARKSLVCSQRLFRQFVELTLEKKTESFITLNYDDIYNILTNILGRENVCLLIYEDMTDDPKYFVNQLSKYIPIQVKRITNLITAQRTHSLSKQNMNQWQMRSFSDSDKRLFKWWVWLREKFEGDKLLWKRNQHIHLTEELQSKILDSYAENNKCLAKVLGRKDLYQKPIRSSLEV